MPRTYTANPLWARLAAERTAASIAFKANAQPAASQVISPEVIPFRSTTEVNVITSRKPLVSSEPFMLNYLTPSLRVNDTREFYSRNVRTQHDNTVTITSCPKSSGHKADYAAVIAVMAEHNEAVMQQSTMLFDF